MERQEHHNSTLLDKAAVTAATATATATVDTPEDTTDDDTLNPRLQALSLNPPTADGATNEKQHISTIDPKLLPPNWPKDVKYLVDYEYHPSISTSLLDLVQGRRRKKEELQEKIYGSEGDPLQARRKDKVTIDEEEEEKESRSETETKYDDIPIGHAIPGLLPQSSTMDSTTVPAVTSLEDPSPAPTPTSPPYEIRLITSPSTHPVLGSYGLFATRTLRPGLHLLDYISLIVPDESANPESDHTLYLCHDLNLDASTHGNHGRFVNDFRGIRPYEQGPNVGWDLYRDQTTGQVRMGCKVLKRIRKDEEILCTYGKAYWKSRGIKVTGNDWEDAWDTDMEDWSEDDSDTNRTRN
ncbi:MAG: hypothetical protein J3Q66DRAFT_335806 [Benniella sp.]|nr:MAG: hypothetical protein J3Q66DRAFT_335806 [Benniella sp.]